MHPTMAGSFGYKNSNSKSISILIYLIQKKNPHALSQWNKRTGIILLRGARTIQVEMNSLWSFCSSILRRINVVTIPNNQYLSPLLVLEQLCLRTGAWCSALRRVSRFTGVSLTGVTGSETPLPGSLAGSGGDSMMCFLLELSLLVYHDAPRCDSELRGLV